MLRKQGIVHDIVKIVETIYGNISDKVVSFLDEKKDEKFFCGLFMYLFAFWACCACGRSAKNAFY
ncbi:peptidase, M16 family domain protein [Anaplasma phagocytophilum]|nr:hypothetical protein HGE1_05027 [Anaplasma phagocytophilum str. HGE1]KJV60474.1 peptidase, M16 family domain protein [Anaplasma phagocytophilum str. Webster]KJV97999.1 peptidase, M16 family domain protein [Anaplasma phagocytophilum str. Annie]KKA00555.1 peptidase, M16 family domain protein [Anaplasma phagocytophilum]